MKPAQFIVSQKSESSIEPIPEDLHYGVLVRLYDVGSQYSETFDKLSRKLVLQFELPDLPHIEAEIDGKKVSLPRLISYTVTKSLHEKAKLKPLLETWRGRRFTTEELNGFDIANIVGKPGNVQVLHTHKDGKTYANISNVLPYPKGMPQTKPTTETLMFSVDQLDSPEELETLKLPEWIQNLVKTSREWERLTAPKAAPKQAPAPVETATDDGGDVPF